MWRGLLILLGLMVFSVLKIVIEDRNKQRLLEEKRIEQEKKREEAIRKGALLAEERKQKEQVYEKLTKKYPYGIASYKKQNPTATLYDIVENETKIKSLDILGREYEHFSEWSKRQIAFAKKSRNLSPDEWGCYYHDIHLLGVDEAGKEDYYSFRIWQHFYFSYCTDETLDYTHFQSTHDNCTLLNECKRKQKHFTIPVFKEVLSIIQGLSENVIVLFAGSGVVPNLTSFESSLNYYHFKYLREELDKNGIRYWDIEYDILNLPEQQDIDIVIVELDTTNVRLRKICNRVFDKLRVYNPCITYISFFKEHSPEEMVKLISEKEKELREEEEKKRIEAEKKRIEEEKKRQDAEYKRRTIVALKSATSSWGKVPFSDIPHTFCIRYYPTTCEFDATEEEWYDRQLIWSFKNDPNKRTRIPHDEALDELMPWVEEELKDTFGDLLSNLTLVCIPASTPAKNEARYELFSNLLCQATGMTNAYSHMVINEERVARHEGGIAGETDTITFDEEFFKGKNILLFDDLLTRGDSMRKFGRKMSSLGANVIASMTIGKTFHTREIDESRGNQGRYINASDDDDDDEDFPF